MNDAAPAFLVALEASGAGQAIRQSVWMYPTANVIHVVALAVFAGAVAVMDVRLLGGLSTTALVSVVKPARRWAMTALLVLLASGAVLFVAEASHVAMNPVFQIKAVLILAALANAVLIAGPALAQTDPLDYNPSPRLKAAAAISLSIWLAVAASGRLIAYF